MRLGVKKVRQPQHLKVSMDNVEVTLKKRGWRKPAGDGREELRRHFLL